MNQSEHLIKTLADLRRKIHIMKDKLEKEVKVMTPNLILCALFILSISISSSLCRRKDLRKRKSQIFERIFLSKRNIFLRRNVCRRSLTAVSFRINYSILLIGVLTVNKKATEFKVNNWYN